MIGTRSETDGAEIYVWEENYWIMNMSHDYWRQNKLEWNESQKENVRKEVERGNSWKLQMKIENSNTRTIKTEISNQSKSYCADTAQ